MDYSETDQSLPESAATEQVPAYMKVQKPLRQETATKIQKSRVITREDLPNPLFRFGVTLALLMPLLAVVAIYYGWINP